MKSIVEISNWLAFSISSVAIELYFRGEMRQIGARWEFR